MITPLRASNLAALAAVLALTGAQAAAAQPEPKPADDTQGAPMPASATKTGKGTGVITEIDANDGSLTLKHEPIASLGWPAMTMSFRVVPTSLLNGLKVGQKIGFDARQGTGLPEITAIRKP